MNENAISKRQLLGDIWIASRPLSLTLAIYSTTLGIAFAHLENKLFTENIFLVVWKIFLVTFAGILVQTATNFINDYFECEFKHREQKGKKHKFLGKYRSRFDILIFMLGIACFSLTGLIGIYLMYITSTKLLVVGILGIIGGYSYTGEPIVYKKRGLGTPLSFVLMGPLMVYGSYLVFTGSFSWNPIYLSLPVSLMIPLLMMSNEIRDFKRDGSLNIKTLTVRIGYKRGKMLFLTLLVSSYILTALYVFLKLIPSTSVLVFITLPLAVKSYKTVSFAKKEGVPITNRLHLSFGLIFILFLFL